MYINNSHDKSLIKILLLSFVILLLLTGMLMGDTNLAAARSEKLVVIPGATISTDTTWTLANSPYVITGWVYVNAGVTLTIEPGVVVKFSGTIGMVNYGTLDVNGVDGTPVIFTEYRDDTAGGDTNGDLGGSLPAPGAWTGMYVTNNANAYFEYAEIRYGGAVFFNGDSTAPHYGNLRKDGAGTLTLDHTLVTQSLSCGVRFDSSNGVNTITDSTFSFNGGYGVCLYNPVNTISFSGSTFAQNAPWSIYTTPSSSGFSIPPDNLLDKPIHVDAGSMTVNSNWSRQVYLLNGLTVNTGVTLTIPSGAVVKFNGPTSMIVYGTLEVNGNDSSPVIFTELRDDTAGGDTNGDGGDTLPTPGGWNGMYVTDNANASFEYAEIRYGGAVFFNGDSTAPHYGNLRKDGTGTLSLDHTLVTQSLSCGVRFNSSNGVNTIADSTFSFNGGYGVCLYDALNTISFTGSIFAQNSPWSIYTTPKSSGFSIPPDNILDKPIHVDAGSMAVDSTWSRQVYLLNGLTVNAGVTLTIPSGAVVKFNGPTSMIVYGNLDVNGTDDSPVIFTELRDDTAGGDTNGDGGDTLPAPGGWNGMYVVNNANASFEYAEIRYGGAVFFNGDSTAPHFGNLRKDGAGMLTLDHTLVTQSLSCGVRFNGSTGVNTITDSTFSFNSGYGACLYDALNTISFSGSTFAQNAPWSIYTTPFSSGFSIPPDNLLDKPIHVDAGSMTVNSNWSRQVYLLNGLTVNAGVTLTIPSGAVVKFNGPTSMIVNGNLDVNGVDGTPVIFTELRDDTAGGDTNGDAGDTLPAPGGWNGMYVTDNANASFEYAEIRYGGAVFFNGNSTAPHYGNLRKDGAGTLTLDHTVVTQSLSCGVRFDSSNGVNTIADSTFSFNGGYGVCLYNPVNTISFSGSTFAQNAPWSIYTTPFSSGFSIPPNNILDKPIFVDTGSMAVDSTWSRQVYVTNSFTVNSGYSLTIPAGAVLKFIGMSGITVAGTLEVNGTEALPVIITEMRDDSAGGDSNGDGASTSPAAGAWTGLYVPGGNASFTYAEIRYGGGTFFNGDSTACHYGNLRKGGSGTLTTDHLTSMYSGCSGLWLTSTVTEAEILDSHFVNNNGWGVLYQTSASALLLQRNLIDHNSGGGLHINNPGGISEVDQNTIVANNGAGIQVTNESPALIGGTDANGNNLYGNTGFQLQNLNGTTSVNASHNWWGINPPFASGISGLVDYTSPLTAPAANAPVYLADIMLSGPNIPATAMVNDTVAYTLYFTNGGPREAYHLVFTATIPFPAELLTVSGSGWDCSVDGNQFTCYMPYLAADGVSEISFSIRSAVPSPLSFDVSISQANNDPLSQNNGLTIHTTIVMQVMLPLITK
jgi:hypothetical protein